MAEVQNCPTCNGIFNYTGVRDICPMCAREEDKMYEKVYRFLEEEETALQQLNRSS